MEFYAHILVLAGIILAMTAFKVVSCKPFKEDGEDFDWKKLMLGMFANAIVLTALSATYYLGLKFGSDLIAVQLGETSLTLHAALDVLMIAIIGVYSAKLVKNVQEYFGLTKDNAAGTSEDIRKLITDMQTTFETAEDEATDEASHQVLLEG